MNIALVMMRSLKALFFIAVFFISVTLQAQVSQEAQAEIEGLLERVANSGCQFERNGVSHNAETARDHLRLKYKRGKRYVSDAQTFIDRLASKSSWSGKVYMMTCPNEPSQPSGLWLHQQLDILRSQKDQ